MPSYPTISTGDVAKYPVKRTRKFRSRRHVFVDQSEQRFRKGVPMTEFELVYRRISTEDKDLLRQFYVGRQGELDMSWDLTFDGEFYSDCMFIGPFDASMTAPDLWDHRIKIAGFPGISSSPAVPLLVFGTGLDASGALLSAGAVDPHWTLNSSADSNYPGPTAYVVNSIASGWVANQSSAQWIAPNPTFASGRFALGNYIYRHSFSMSGYDPATFAISGKYASDNKITGIWINGTLISSGGGSYGGFLNFTINSGFVTGTNTLDFRVENTSGIANNPTGLIVQITSATGEEL